MAREFWWRLALDADGKVKSVRVVEEAGADGGGIFFVRASSEDGARLAGKDAFNAYHRDLLRKRREKYRQEGRCACGRKRDVSGCTTCSVCQKTVQTSRERRELKAAGKPVPQLNVGDALQRRRRLEDDQIRRDALRDALRQYRVLQKRDFERWIEAEIAELAKRSAA